MIVVPLSNIEDSIQNSEKVAHESNKWGDYHCKHAHDISSHVFFAIFFYFLTNKHACTPPNLRYTLSSMERCMDY